MSDGGVSLLAVNAWRYPSPRVNCRIGWDVATWIRAMIIDPDDRRDDHR